MRATTSAALSVEASTLIETPLIVKEPVVTAVANPAFAAALKAVPWFTPPTGPALVTEYGGPPLLTCATSSLSTCSRLPRSAVDPSDIGSSELDSVTAPFAPTVIEKPGSTDPTAL